MSLIFAFLLKYENTKSPNWQKTEVITATKIKLKLILVLILISSIIFINPNVKGRIIDNTLNILTETKEKSVEFKDLMIVNNKLFVFLKNSYVLKFNINGVLEKIDKLPSKLNSHPIIVENSILFLDYKNKISIVD